MGKIKRLMIGILKELKDWRNVVIFIIVVIVLGATVWVPLLIGLITKDGLWYSIAAIVEGIWLGPVPFIPICIGLTLLIRRLCVRKRKTDRP